MKRKLILGLLILSLIAVPLFAAACEEEVTPTGEEEEEEGPPGEEEEVEGDWWDEFGEPQYGGTLTVLQPTDWFHADPHTWFVAAEEPYWDVLFNRDWTVDRNIESFKTEFVSPEYYTGGLAESWEYTDPLTVTVRIHQGVHWQNKAPLNGRELTAYDVEYTYDRILGTGSGFTEPNAMLASFVAQVERVVATDTYTVDFQMKESSFWGIYDVFGGGFGAIAIIAPELVEQNCFEDWQDAVGSGPYMLTEYVSGSSTTYTKNPDYWGYDERHPENQLPYITEIKKLIISDVSTGIAAMRSGQIDIYEQIDAVSLIQAQQIAETNPEIQQAMWSTPGLDIDLRFDQPPFDDIRVRKALQMAIDLKTIAETHYLGVVSGDPEGVVSLGLTGWTLPYDQWPAELQAEYSYDPDTAIALLAEAAADGVFEPNDLGGFDTSIVASTMEDIQLLEIIQSQFKDIGVNMEIQIMDYATKQALAGQYDGMFYNGRCGKPQSSLKSLDELMPDSSLGGFPFNDDQQFQALINQLSAATTEDEARRLSIEADMYVFEQHWLIVTFSTRSTVLWQPWVKGNSGEFYAYCLAPFYYARYWIDEDLKQSMGY